MWSSTKRTIGKLSKKDAGEGLSERGNRPGIMPFEANAAIPEGGTGAAFWGWIVPVDRHERRGKNGSVRLPGTHKPQYRGLRDDEDAATRCLHSDPSRVLVSTCSATSTPSSEFRKTIRCVPCVS